MRLKTSINTGRLCAFALAALLCLPLAASAREAFIHPGLLHGKADLQRMRSMVKEGAEPVKSGFEVFKADSYSQLSYSMQGPFAEIGRLPNVNNTRFDSDANAAYQLALMWAITGEKPYAEKSASILNAWSYKLEKVTGLDAVLMAGLGPFKMINAAEILRCTDSGWAENDIEQFDKMLLYVIYPAIENFATFANGNWDASAIQTMLAIGVFCDNRAIFDKALRYYTAGSGNGCIFNYVINEAGQCQESGRDQQHTQLGLALLAACCEIAWQQGLDLYSYADNRLLKGFEYTTKYNLGEDVPFAETTDTTGKSHHKRISTEGRGALRAVYEMVYNHYVNRAGVIAPWTEKAAAKVRPEGAGRPSADHPGFGTLLFTRPQSKETGRSVEAYLEANAGFAVHDYGRSGDDLTTVPDESEAAGSSRCASSTKYSVTANQMPVSAYKYQKGSATSGYYNFDIARFSSADRAPQFTVTLRDDTVIDSVEIYPAHYYPQDALNISADKKTLTFAMSERLPYCIVNINGKLADMNGNPMLALINDSPETNAIDAGAANVLNFKAFAESYLKEHPITDKVGEVCRPAGTLTDTSRNTLEEFTWSYEAGHFVSAEEKDVLFPDKRVREKRDVSDAFQAALEAVKASKTLDTIYFPAGTYVWSGLCIKDWRGNGADGKLTIYTDEDALLVNRIQECKNALEPAIGIWNSSNITISGRGIFDANGCGTLQFDRKDARDTPHQGGSMVVHSQDITFNDTYLRDAKQWNWECHTAENITYNNIKGLSPYAHAWIDGLDLTSGQNITVNGALTLGNDDTFASGHYNPSDEFPRRFLEELDRASGENKGRMEAQKARVCAAAAFYNKDRLKWDTADSENISLNNTLGWSGLANNIRLGANTRWKGEPGKYGSYKLKSYSFNNFNSVMRTAIDAVRVQNGSMGSYPQYESLTFKDCSFAGCKGSNIAIPSGNDLRDFAPETVLFENCIFDDPGKPVFIRNVKNLTMTKVK